jgi:hypothetical protein
MSSGGVWMGGYFLVRDCNKTLGLHFVLMVRVQDHLFPLWVYPNPICLFLTHFYKPDGHPKFDGCRCNFPSKSISSPVRFLVHLTHCHPYARTKRRGETQVKRRGETQVKQREPMVVMERGGEDHQVNWLSLGLR